MTKDPTPLRRALSSGDFRRFFAARTLSQWGDTFNSVAIVILVYRLTRAALPVGGAVAFEVAPTLLLGFVAGPVADRLPRRAVMVTADLGRAGVATVLAVFPDHLWVVYAAAFSMSALTVFFNPAAASVVPSLVAGEDLVGANSAVWSGAVISQVALAPAAGALVALAGAGPAFGINAASFLASAALLARLALPRPPEPNRQSRTAQIAEGLRAVRTSRLLTVLAGVQGLAALSAGASSALLVILAARHLHLGSGRFGLLLGAIGVGAGMAPLAVQRVVRDTSRPGWLFGPYLLRGAVDIGLATITSFAGALAALAAYGVGTSTGNITYHTVIQSTVPDRLRGRVFTFYDVIWQSARLASIAAGGVLADALGITVVYYLAGALLLIAGTLGLLLAPIPARADSHNPAEEARA